MEKESFSDGFVVDYDVSSRVSGCCGRHLSFPACAATHTWFLVKMCLRFLAVTSYLPCDNKSYWHLCRQPFTLTRASDRTVAELFCAARLAYILNNGGYNDDIDVEVVEALL